MKPSKKIVYLMLIALCNISLVYAKQERSQEAKDSFKYSHPCPSNGNNHGPCPGYVIDHITPLACDGADDPGNMQWQTEAEGKAKDKWERKGCKTGNSGSHSYSGSSSSGSGSYQTGPKGGCFTYSASGKKKYVDHSYCGH
ncbi:MAG: hypothetical protein WCH34_17410 [Bacteroidota bacterium]